MTAPKRIHRSATKPWLKPGNTVFVGHPSYWENPWSVGDGFKLILQRACDPACNDGRVIGPDEPIVSSFVTPETAVALYRAYSVGDEEEIRRELAGKNLACWCPLDQACHADFLLTIANGEPS